MIKEVRVIIFSFMIALALVFSGVWPVEAIPITYVEETIGTGALGGNNFADSLVRLTFVGDTTNVTKPVPGIFVITVGTATVFVANIGTTIFTDLMGVFDNQNNVPTGAGISDFTNHLLVLGTGNIIFANYGLDTAIGPISGPSTINPPGVGIFPTTLGNFILNVVGHSTFTATVSAVPEPSIMLLVGSGLLALAGLRRKLKP